MKTSMTEIFKKDIGCDYQQALQKKGLVNIKTAVEIIQNDIQRIRDQK